MDTILKIGYSTNNLCVFTLKQIIEFYNKMSSVVCLLDASKAFDRLNHWTLFEKLIKQGIPIILVRLAFYVLVLSSTVLCSMGEHYR